MNCVHFLLRVRDAAGKVFASGNTIGPLLVGFIAQARMCLFPASVTHERRTHFLFTQCRAGFLRLPLHQREGGHSAQPCCDSRISTCYSSSAAPVRAQTGGQHDARSAGAQRVGPRPSHLLELCGARIDQSLGLGCLDSHGSRSLEHQSLEQLAEDAKSSSRSSR